MPLCETGFCLAEGDGSQVSLCYPINRLRETQHLTDIDVVGVAQPVQRH